MHLKPLHDRVVVRRLSAETLSQGGIIIPDTAKEKPNQGEVVAVGQGAISDDGKVRTMVVKEGDKVIFGQYSGTEVKVNGEELLVIRESDIFAIVESENVKEKAA